MQQLVAEYSLHLRKKEMSIAAFDVHKMPRVAGQALKLRKRVLKSIAAFEMHKVQRVLQNPVNTASVALQGMAKL